MAHRIEVRDYSLALSRGERAMFRIDGRWVRVDWAARIVVTGRSDDRVWKALIFFPADGSEVLDNFRGSSTQPGTERLLLFWPREQYERAVDMLRNEKPVFLVWDDGYPRGAYLTTEKEPVGEGEVTTPALATTQDPRATIASRSYAPFDEAATGHSLVNGYLLAHASREIYGDGLADTTGSLFLEWFVDRFTPWMTVTPGAAPRFDFVSDNALLGGTGVQAMVMSNDRFVIVVFRGTQALGTDALDWTSNVAFLGAPTQPLWAPPGVLVHGGWLSATEKVYPEILDLVQKHSETPKPLWLAGHSLGGALALIHALRMHLTGDAVVQGVNTYGCPPAGGGRFFAVFDDTGLHDRTRRWVNNNDIVPQLPLLGYSAVGRKTFIDESGEIEPDAPVATPTWPSVADHSIVAYCDLIRAELSPPVAGAVPF